MNINKRIDRQTFADSSAAFDFAERKSKYGHRSWLVWKVKDGTWVASRRTVAAMEEAVAATDFDTDYIHAIDPDPGFFTRYGPSLATIVLKNLKAGHIGGE